MARINLISPIITIKIITCCIFLLNMSPLVAYAETESDVTNKENPANQTSQCIYKKGFVDKIEILDDRIEKSFWLERPSGAKGNTTSLFITYKNGDQLIIEHNYCMMYEFKVNFFPSINANTSPPDRKAAAKLLASLFNQHSKIKVTFNPGFENVLFKNFESYPAAWNNYDYHLEKSLNLELSVAEHNIKWDSMIFSKMYSLYVGIGGTPD